MSIFRRLRTLVRMPGAAAPNEYGFALGAHVRPYDDETDEANEPPAAVYAPALHGHLHLRGGAGTGKTVLLRALSDDASQVMDVHTVDSWGTMDKESALRPSGAASSSFTSAECAETLEGIRTEVRRRVQQCSLEGAASFKDLENPPRRILVVLDDTRFLFVEEEHSCDGHPHRAAKLRSVECIDEIAENARVAGVTFVFSSQWAAGESGISANVLAGPVSTLELTTHSYGRFGFYKPIQGPGVAVAHGGPIRRSPEPLRRGGHRRPAQC
jgi:hypothetical protein